VRAVTIAARDRLAARLAEVAVAGAFSAQRTAPADDLRLEVRGVGALRLPVPEAQAEQLYLVGRPAQFGRGEQTLLDRSVRDTQEVPLSRVKIDKRRWARTLDPLLDQLRGDLGLPPSCDLSPELHSMLVYGRGQFFVSHQDSEKDDVMVGSLVVTLPSSHRGGALVVEHAGKSVTYRPPKGGLSFVAFYSDCRHQVQPVTSGYRIVLTYNLLVHGDTATPAAGEALAQPAGELASLIGEHLATRVTKHYGSGDADPPGRLVYLLDHEYTERGLSWARLKGSDARRAALLRAAAERADCEVALALADVHETWSAFEPDKPWYGRRGYRGWGWDDDDPDEEEPDPDEYELDELVDWSIQLDCWIDEPGSPAEKISLAIADFEVCQTTRSEDLVPYASEYEGYMGNYGNTLDRWYRRAAVVLWPRQRAFVVRAEASPRWALDALAARLRSGDAAGAQADAAALAPFWDAVATGEHQRGLFAKALTVAHGLDEPVTATTLLAPFRVEMLTSRHAVALTRLVKRYGERWSEDLLQTWSGRVGQDRLAWLASLPRLCEALQALGSAGTSSARLLVAGSWRWLSEEIERRRALGPPSARNQALGKLGPPLASVLEAISVIGAADLCEEAAAFADGGGDELIPCLLSALRAATKLPPARRTASGLSAIANDCAARLTARLAHTARAGDDWSIKMPGGCACELCKTLGDFLRDPAQRSFEWPLREDSRRHVHSRIDMAELPVSHQTRRSGRPYTLVLIKTDALFERERQARGRDQADAAWLDKAWIASGSSAVRSRGGGSSRG